MKRLLNYLWPAALCLILGYIASKFQATSMAEWYPTLIKSPLTPPNMVFPIAWSIIYLLIGLSLGRLLEGSYRKGVYLWFVQIALNFLWSILFFTMRMPLYGLLEIMLLDVVVFAYMIYVRNKDKIAMYLFIPYLIWLLFATYLNAYIFFNN